jgi:hypothetical protein
MRKAMADRDFGEIMRLGKIVTRTGIKLKPDLDGSDLQERRQISLTAYG